MDPARCGRLLLWIAGRLIRGPGSRFVLADLDDALERDLAHGLPPWRGRIRLLINILASSASVVRSWRWSPATLLFEMARSARTLAREPGFALPVCLSLALTIGATTAVFSVVDAVLLRPLPYPEAERIRAIFVRVQDQGQRYGLSAARTGALLAEPGIFESVAWYRDSVVTLTGVGQPRELVSATVGPDHFRALGSEPLVGGGFAASARGGERVAYLSEGIWRQDFGSDASIVGRRIDIDDLPTTVLGVVPTKQALPAGTEIWLPLLLESIPDNQLHSGNQSVFVRLAPGITDAELGRRIERISDDILATYPESYPGSFMTSQSLRAHIVQDAGELLVVMLAAVALLFVLGSANVANLVLVRNRRQQVIVATRAALGGSRSAIVRWLLSELLVLGGVAAVGGTLLAAATAPSLLRLTQIVGPGMEARVVDPRTLGFAVTVTLLASLAVGFLPATAVARMDLASVLRRGSGRTGGRGARRSQGLLVAGQAALGVVLIIASAQTLGELQRLSGGSEGFRLADIVTVQTRAPESRYADSVQYEQMFRELRESLLGVPGVMQAGGASHMPIGESRASFSISIEDQPPADPNHVETAHAYLSLPGYTESMGIPLLAGRTLQSTDTAESEPVAVVSKSFAQRFWPGETAIGKRIKRRTYASPFPWITVVGVVGDVRNDGLDGDPGVAFHMLHGQTDTSFSRRMYFVVQSTRPVDQLSNELRARIAMTDPDLPLARIASIEELLNDALATRRLATVMLAVFALIGLTLLGTGTYGVVAFAVAQRRAELGLRKALGAEGPAIIALVLRTNVGYLAAGATVGIVIAAVVSRAVDPTVIPPAAPSLFGAAAAMLLLVGLASSLPPALRAARLDPTTSLREGLR